MAKLKKIKTQSEIIKIVHSLRSQNKKIATINGGFDILHIGHTQSLQKAKSLGDALIVLLNSDNSIRKYKGEGRPAFSQAERAELISSLGCVDYVTIFDDINPKKILDKVKPDIHCVGSAWGKYCVEKEVVERNGGAIYKINLEKRGVSTTNIIKKILETHSQPPAKAVFFDRDGTINLNKQGYIYRIEDFEFVPSVFRVLRKIKENGYKIIIITNQSGIGRGYFKEKDLLTLHKWMAGAFKREGIDIDGIYYCPHKPEQGCTCRKPEIGMIEQAVRDFHLSLNDSWMVGDGEADVALGREVNTKTIKIGKKLSRGAKIAPHYYAGDLLDVSKIILSEDEK